MRKASAPIFGKFWTRRFFSLETLEEIWTRIRYGPKYMLQRIRNGYCTPDTWEIDCWFLRVMPGMLAYLRDNRLGSPACFDEMSQYDHYIGDGTKDDECHKKWTEILNRMIFLLNEMDEDKCTKKNPYEMESKRNFADFEEKYGFLGEKIQGPEEDAGSQRVYLPAEMPEYEKSEGKWFEEEEKIMEYRNKCKDEFFEMFSKYFYFLLD